MTTYINIDERYGETVPVTLADYQELNPDGKFEQRDDAIVEWLQPNALAPITVALSEYEYNKETDDLPTGGF